MTPEVEYLFDIRYAPLPPREPARGRGETSAVIGADGHGCHVLVLDDEAAIVEILCEVLEDEGCRVTGFGTPPAVEEVARLAPDLIILDLIFGGQNAGLGFLAMLRSSPATAAIPVVVCTALTDPGIASALAQLRPEVRVLTKPFDIDEVGGFVRSAVGVRESGWTV
jgi:two-component system, OmpR family, response regulator